MKKSENKLFPCCNLIIKVLILNILFAFNVKKGVSQVYYPGAQPGKAEIIKTVDKITLRNSILNFSLVYTDKLRSMKFINTENKKEYEFGHKDLFSFILSTGDSLSSDEFQLKGVQTQKGDGKKGPYVKAKMNFLNTEYGITFDLNIELDDGANYITQTYGINAGSRIIDKIYTLRIPQRYNPKTVGKVDGDPIVTGNMSLD